MDEIRAYFENSAENLKSSKILYEKELYRNSISMSYYSMFLCAKALLLKEGYTPKTHKGIIHLFGEKFVKNGLFDKKIYSEFSNSETLRQEADYDAFSSINKYVASKQIKNAEIFYQEAKKLL